MKAVHTKMNNFREIQASLNEKTARYPSRREPNNMEIESTSCGLKVGMLIPLISKLKKLLKKESMVCMKLKG